MKRISNKDNRLTTKDVIFYSAVLKNPILIQAIGLCPVVAIAISLKTSVILAVITLLVLVVTEVMAAALFKKVARWLRVIIYSLLGVIIVAPIMFLMEKFADAQMSALGIYLPLLAFNSVVVLQCENVAMKTTVSKSFIDALASSLGYGAVLIIVGALREILGNGTIWGITISENFVAKGLLMPFGGFLIIGFLAAALKWIFTKKYPDYAEQLETNSRLTIEKRKPSVRNRSSNRARSARRLANQNKEAFYVANMQTTVKTVTVQTETVEGLEVESEKNKKKKTTTQNTKTDETKPRRGRPPKESTKKEDIKKDTAKKADTKKENANKTETKKNTTKKDDIKKSTTNKTENKKENVKKETAKKTETKKEPAKKNDAEKSNAKKTDIKETTNKPQKKTEKGGDSK